MTKNGLKVVAALAALGVAGCGGGDSNKALSYSDFGKKADAICKDVNPKVEAASSGLTGKATADAPLYDDLIPVLQDGGDRISKLKPPAELKPPFTEFLSVNDQQIAKAKEAQTVAKTGDDAAYVAVLKSIKPLGAQGDAAASKMGAAECTK